MGFNVMPTFALRPARGTNRRVTAPALAVVLASLPRPWPSQLLRQQDPAESPPTA